MLLKLGLTGIRRRLADYLILFSGLIISSAIFYLFMSIATNEHFLKQNISIFIGDAGLPLWGCLVDGDCDCVRLVRAVVSVADAATGLWDATDVRCTALQN